MNWKHEVYKWLRSDRFRFYPKLCLLCGKDGGGGRDLCIDCWRELPGNPVACFCCGTPLTGTATLCGPCSRRPPPYAHSIIPFRYGPPLDYLLQQLKFHQQLQVAPLLGGLLAEAVADEGGSLPQLILPVPLHRARLRERGYNQALELARPLSQQLAIPVGWQCCRRLRSTPAQTSLQGRERRKNLRGAFQVSGKLPAHVAIVDDVVTTGATVGELAAILRRAGVERVDVWAVARAGQ